jgi:hypothetical protein
VARPVSTTSAVPVPLLTLVPMKMLLTRSASPSALTGPTRFSTGKLSPVSTAWLTCRSCAAAARHLPERGCRR